MKENAINWDAVPDVITKDQLYRICHISKSTALYLLQSGKIPCEYTGRKTRCYKIKKEDVIAYLENRKVFPESYSAPAGWYKGDYTVQMEEQVPQIVREHLRLYYTELLSGYPDVLTTQEVSKITGYGKTSRRFPKSPATEKLQSTTGVIRGTSSLSGKTMSTTFRRFIWWSSFALHTSVPPSANRRGTSAPCKAFQAGGKSVTCTRQTTKEVRSNGKFSGRAILRKY